MNDSTEQQLRREIEELRRQLRLQHDPHQGPPAAHWRPSGLTISVLLLAFAVLLAIAFFSGYGPLQKREATVEAEAAEREKALPRMDVIHLSRAASTSGITLPGTMQALTEAPLLARADGYLKARSADIGDHVHAGQTLALIDAPELDQQIRQAQAAIDQAQASLEQSQANLAQGKTNLELARVTAERYQTLTAQGVVSKQDNDQYQAQFNAQTANLQALEKAVTAQQSNVAAAKANLARLEELHGYLTVKAPFDGVITQRNVDIGALVNTGNTVLFRMAQIGTLRTFINVPQINANNVHAGQQARLMLSNFPGRTFRGAVARTANSLDPSSRTMLTEIDVPNPDGSLFPGMYADVTLTSTLADPPLVVPATALITRSNGAELAEVTPDGVIHLHKVTVGRDYGDRVEILQGIDEGAAIVATPGDSAQEGVKIAPVDAGGSQR